MGELRRVRAVCCVAEATLTHEYIVQTMANTLNTLASTATEEQRRDYFSVLAAIAPAPPDAQRSMRCACTQCMTRAQVHGRRARLSVPGSSGDIFSEGSSEFGSEEPL